MKGRFEGFDAADVVQITFALSDRARELRSIIQRGDLSGESRANAERFLRIVERLYGEAIG